MQTRSRTQALAPLLVEPKAPAPPAVIRPVVYVSNLPKEAGSNALLQLFEEVDIEPESVELLMQGLPGRMKSSGMASVFLKSDEDVQKACQQVDGRKVFGRPAIVRKDKFVDGRQTYSHEEAAFDTPARKPAPKMVAPRVAQVR